MFNKKILDVEFVIICSTPRSGSSTMVEILNTIQSSNITGENDGAIINILKAYKSIKNTINFRPTYKNPSSIQLFNENKICLAWYNSFDYEKIIKKIKSLIIEICKKSKSDKLIGFKEIRFYKNTDLLYDFLELFPKTKIICTIRNNIDTQINSKHFNTHDLTKTKNYVSDYTNEIIDFNNKNKNNSIIFELEDMYNLEKLKNIFLFLKKENSFNVSKIEQIINKKTTTIYWKYNNLLPKNFNCETYRLLNDDLKNMVDYDLIIHYVNFGKNECRKHMFDVVCMTIVKNEENNIIEWIKYNLSIGIEHIYIYDDMSQINLKSYLKTKLDDFEFKSLTIYRINNDVFSEYVDNDLFKKYFSNKQEYIINYFIKNNPGISQFCLFCDIDEYIEFFGNYKNIYEVIKSFTEFKYDGIYLYSIFYGTSYNIVSQKNTSVFDTYNRCGTRYEELGKSIIKLNSFNSNDFINVHTIKNNLHKFNLDSKLFDLPIHINHYVTKSVFEFLSKKLKEEIGTNFGAKRSPNYIYNMLIKNNDLIRLFFNNCVNNFKEKYAFNKPKYFEGSNLLNLKNKMIIPENVTYDFLKYLKENIENLNYYTPNLLKSNLEYKTFCKNYSKIHPKNENIDNIQVFSDFINSNKINNELSNYPSGQILINDNLPSDFCVDTYRELNPDLNNYTTEELISHFKEHGQFENRIYSINLPSDFDSDSYLKYNPDLKNLTKTELMCHYQKTHIAENRIYKVDLPNDFNSETYKKLNPDLENLTTVELEKHYYLYGTKEKRLYKQNLPINFNSEMYLFLNPDLKIFTNKLELEIHYQTNGMCENRKYIDVHFDENYFVSNNKHVRKHKNNYTQYLENINCKKNFIFDNYVSNLKIKNDKNIIFLVNHDDEKYGAGHYLHLTYNYFTKEYPNIKFYMLETQYQDFLTTRYNIPQSNVIEYFGDPTLLLQIYYKINPIFVYLNSANYAIYHVIDHLPQNKFILHSHEIKPQYLLQNKIVPHYVVSKRIANQYLLAESEILIQPPFLNNIEDILNNGNVTDDIFDIKNKYGKMNYEKINICMCGQISDRKNYKLFIQIAQEYQNYNFIWIGGSTEESYLFDSVKNIYHITFTDNPYKYYKNVVDYFILFSLADPCPFVVLENMLFGINIITFKENIYTEHTSELIKNIYNEYNGNISFENCKNAIDIYVKEKRNKNIPTENNKKYVIENYSKPIFIQKKINEILSINDNNDT